MTALEDLGKVVLVFLVATNVLSHPSALRLFLILYVSCFTLFPVRGTIFNYYIYDSADFGRPAWRLLFGNTNDMAALTILALALAAGFLHKDAPRLVRAGAFLACLVFPFVILLTQSRASFIGLFVFVLLVVTSVSRHRIRSLVVLAAIAGAVITAAPTDVWNRVAGLKFGTSEATIRKMDPEGSAAQRWEIFQTGLRIFVDNPVLGVGIGRYQQANSAYNPELGARSVHNTYLEVLAETGVPGFVLFLWFLSSLVFRARKARRNATHLRQSADWRRLQLLEFGLYGFLAAGLFGNYGFLSMFYIYLAVFFAQAEVIAASNQKHSTRVRFSDPIATRV